jgi:CDP-glycerol glycerophosphotransferase (TagB/SpsB family)
MPPYDGYVRKEWVIPRQEYFAMHGLDPQRKLLTYASSFVNLSPNIQNVTALARLVSSDQLFYPAQLLVRFHPNHMSGHYVAEAEQIRQLARENPLVHVIEPATFGAMGHYSIEDLTDRTSMMAHSDVFMTVYSTMVVEASFQEHPIVSVCIDSTEGYPGHYWIPFSEIAIWPTHSRFRASNAGRVATSETELLQALNHYLQNPTADLPAMRRFLAQECANLDGSAGRRTAEYFLTILNV